MFEAEVKFVAGPDFRLPDEPGKAVVCEDVYFDAPDGRLAASGRELRLRREAGRTVLTAKAPPFDAATASKPEHETAVSDAEAVAALLGVLGFQPVLAYAKRCRRARLRVGGLDVELTAVTVDFDPRLFVEIEHLAATREQAMAALPAIRALAAGLGLAEECAVAYTDLAQAAGLGAPPAAP
ncbi:class IV adenylate cyclase [Solidesulfovibrio magneticus]|uniref:Adenylate cyclase n=1 Tax=Solidesulfovibrio magneticus (strain ATCC 700980 / DSM 13731 / RS-1) TaxID=573370 RepID=C4XMV5_SOLM1|nr:CYTH domain-containing protein [Solidesulfovibrio magneticus]BAH74896.1 putative adenylate cyclase [Solidesulfovibrio magneticus RS-1]